MKPARNGPRRGTNVVWVVAAAAAFALIGWASRDERSMAVSAGASPPSAFVLSEGAVGDAAVAADERASDGQRHARLAIGP